MSQAPWYANYQTRLTLPQSQAEFFGRQGKKMEVAANYVSDEAVEFDQHRDNFSMEPSHFRDYYDWCPQNYQYD